MTKGTMTRKEHTRFLLLAGATTFQTQLQRNSSSQMNKVFCSPLLLYPLLFHKNLRHGNAALLSKPSYSTRSFACISGVMQEKLHHPRTSTKYTDSNFSTTSETGCCNVPMMSTDLSSPTHDLQQWHSYLLLPVQETRRLRYDLNTLYLPVLIGILCPRNVESHKKLNLNFRRR
jgi:hypothetical protein